MTSMASSQVYAASGFRCLLDDQPTYLVPSRLLRSQVASNPLLQLHVNSTCRFARGGTASEKAIESAKLATGIPGDSPVVWVRDAATAAITPFWLGARYGSLLAEARASNPAPTGLPTDVREVLAFANVLVDSGYEARRQKQHAEAVAQATEHFVSGFAGLTGLIHPYLIGSLRTYYRRLVRSGALRSGDRRTKLRFVEHNEPMAAFFHHQFVDIVGTIVREPVKPSYSYLSAYQSGAELARHVDREQCEFSISFLIDASPEPERESPWPLHLETPRGTVTIFQCIGDGLLYKGRELPHFRKRLSDGYTSTSIFFHYVRQDFQGSLR